MPEVLAEPQTVSRIGAEEGTRTPTPLRVHGPEPCASANSATSARYTNPAVSAGSAATLSLAKRACRVKSAVSSTSLATSASALPIHPASSANPNPAAATDFGRPAPFRRSGTSRSSSSRCPRSESVAPSPPSRTRQTEPPMHRHLRPERRHLLRKALSRLRSQPIHPCGHCRTRRRKQPLPVSGLACRQCNRRKLRRMQDLVRVDIPHPAD